ncbi:MAG: ABC transporter ATP-binding protein [Candidatus Aminicenantia bacterium]
MNSFLETKNLTKYYSLPNDYLRVFEDINFSVKKKDFVGIMGVSGVGKTTLLNLLGALDKPTRGKVFLEDEDIFTQDELGLAEIRNKKIGFVFQFHHLLPEFTALENVAMPLLIRRISQNEAKEKAFLILREVGLEDRINYRPNKLSAGEQQRVAIARALVTEPKLLLADEPTGNLDWKTGQIVLELIKKLHQKKDLTSIVVTHNERIAQYCEKVYLLEKGKLQLLGKENF